MFAHVDTHHHFEETAIFPHLAKCYGSDIMATSAKEHATFTSGLESAWSYVRACRGALTPPPPPSPIPAPEFQHQTSITTSLDQVNPTAVELGGTTFNPQLFRRQLDTWVPAMLTHLSNEVDVFTDEMAEKVGEKGYWEFDRMLSKHLQSQPPEWFACSSVAGMEIKTVGQLMGDMPVFVRRFLIPFVFSRKYWGYWKYCPHPENLTFSGSGKI